MSKSEPSSWVEWATYNLPARMSSYSLAAQFTGVCFLVPQDTQWEAMSEATYARSQTTTTSPDDNLPYLGQEAGLPQYATEPTPLFRQRLGNKWEQWSGPNGTIGVGAKTGVWQESATLKGIADQISAAFSTVTGDIAALFFYFNLPGGGDNGVTNPSDPSYSPEYAGTGIPLYPASVPIWWSQFALVIFLVAPMGTGASTGGINNQGQLISSDQLLALQLIINKFKPANWACREIVLEYLPVSGTVVWDQLITSSAVFSSASYLYDYDISPITWSSSSVLPPGNIVEHYPVSNFWRWRPIFGPTQ